MNISVVVAVAKVSLKVGGRDTLMYLNGSVVHNVEEDVVGCSQALDQTQNTVHYQRSGLSQCRM